MVGGRRENGSGWLEDFSQKAKHRYTSLKNAP